MLGPRQTPRGLAGLEQDEEGPTSRSETAVGGPVVVVAEVSE